MTEDFRYMMNSALAVGVNAQFMYVPGCMMISFQDNATQTTKITMVKASQGIDLGRMKDTHEIYLDIIHGTLTADEGIDHLEELMSRPVKFSTTVCVLMCTCPWFISPQSFPCLSLSLKSAFTVNGF